MSETNTLTFPGGAAQLHSIADCVSVILPRYKTSQQVAGSPKPIPDQSPYEATPRPRV